MIQADPYSPILINPETLKDFLSLLGKRWTFLIIYNLSIQPRRFTDLKETLGINSRSLTLCLQKLEMEGLIEKVVPQGGNAKRSAYHLTETGEELVIILGNLEMWRKEHKTIARK